LGESEGPHGPHVEVSCVIAEWKKGKSSTEIAELLKLPEHFVASILRREILNYPQEQTLKEETMQTQTVSRLEALKKEMKDRNQK